MKRIFTLVLVFLFLPIASAVTLEIKPSGKAEEGKTLSIEVYASAVNKSVYAGMFTLNYNSTCFETQPDSVSSGSFLRSDGRSSAVVAKIVNNTKGAIEYGETRIGNVPGVSVAGSLVKITFAVKSCSFKGLMPFELTNVKLVLNEQGNLVDFTSVELKNALVEVIAPSPPLTTAPPAATQPPEATTITETPSAPPPSIISGTPSPSLEEQPQAAERNWIIIVAAALVAVLAIGLGYYLGRRK